MPADRLEKGGDKRRVFRVASGKLLCFTALGRGSDSLKRSDHVTSEFSVSLLLSPKGQGEG